MIFVRKKIIFYGMIVAFMGIVHAKKTTWMEYVASDNDLYRWAVLDLQKMAKVGSNQYLDVVVQMDCLGAHGNTKRLHVLPDKIMEVAHGPKLDFGSADTVVDFVKWAVEHYPADNYVLVFWDHGSGFYDPAFGKKISSANDLFYFNAKTQLLEIDRSLPYALLEESEPRGICFCDTMQSYLSNQKLFDALSRITSMLGKKLSIIGFDACLMQMVEVVTQIHTFADYVIASPEVELASGWDYSDVFEPFATRHLDTYALAQHIVAGYERCYKTKSADYTLSAIDTLKMQEVLDSIDCVGKLLISLLSVDDTAKTFKKLIMASRHKQVCTSFTEPSYIDLKHFLLNFTAALASIEHKNEHKDLVFRIREAIERCMRTLEKAIIANVKGKNLPYSSGLAIYFPERRVEPSYESIIFGKTVSWNAFLKFLLKV